jgi:type II secretory pathway component PulF
MNYDEFAFFNQQLAAMVREGVPLEQALKQLAVGMQGGSLRAELDQLQNDLSKGTPLREALKPRALPALYKHLLVIGAQTNDLPGMLVMVADHYHRVNNLWVRLKGLMVYPLLVIVVSLGLTCLLSFAFRRFLMQFFDQFALSPLMLASLWIPPLFLALAAALVVAGITVPRLRERLRWRLPPFREASLAQLASVMALMLRNGASLPEALALAETLEANTPAASTIGRWRSLVESGQGKPSQWPAASPPFPPLFLYLVRQAGENVTGGFEKAAEIYQQRASYRTEMALYAALPVSILLLAQMVFWQAAPLFRSLSWLMQGLGDMGGN